MVDFTQIVPNVLRPYDMTTIGRTGETPKSYLTVRSLMIKAQYVFLGIFLTYPFLERGGGPGWL